MSLILDALQQAEHERGQGRAPELFGAAATATASATPAASAPRQTWLWALSVALLSSLAALTWALWPARPPQAAGIGMPSAPAVSVAPPLAPPTATTATVPATTALFEPPASPPRPDPAPAAPPGRPVAPSAVAPATQPPAPAAPAPVETAPPAAGVPALAELAPEQRAELPALHVTGHTYSDNPTLRTLMIDGRMFVEGQALQPGLRLERIGPHRAVFNHRGTRFGLDY